jgi:hypothetical protein
MMVGFYFSLQRNITFFNEIERNYATVLPSIRTMYTCILKVLLKHEFLKYYLNMHS